MSGKNPIAVSGIAIIAFSVTTRISPWTLMPSPPPIAGPSIRLMYGFG